MYLVEISGDSRYPVDRKRARAAVQRVLKAYGVEGSVVVGLRIVGDRKMRELNQHYRKKKGTTDVLSFPTEELAPSAVGYVGNTLVQSGFVYPEAEAFPLGDVVISYPQALKQAAERDMLVDDEIGVLVEHGVKSLLGDHPEN